MNSTHERWKFGPRTPKIEFGGVQNPKTWVRPDPLKKWKKRVFGEKSPCRSRMKIGVFEKTRKTRGLQGFFDFWHFLTFFDDFWRFFTFFAFFCRFCTTRRFREIKEGLMNTLDHCRRLHSWDIVFEACQRPGLWEGGPPRWPAMHERCVQCYDRLLWSCSKKLTGSSSKSTML